MTYELPDWRNVQFRKIVGDLFSDTSTFGSDVLDAIEANNIAQYVETHNISEDTPEGREKLDAIYKLAYIYDEIVLDPILSDQKKIDGLISELKTFLK